MYALSYLWHGILLNDLNRLTYPIDTFLLLSALAYFGIGMLLAVGIQFVDYGKKNYMKGMLLGIPLGTFIYLIAFVFGISFYGTPQLKYIILDLGWQLCEQTIGGLLAGIIYQLVDRREKFLAKVASK